MFTLVRRPEPSTSQKQRDFGGRRWPLVPDPESATACTRLRPSVVFSDGAVGLHVAEEATHPRGFQHTCVVEECGRDPAPETLDERLSELLVEFRDVLVVRQAGSQ